MVDVDPIIPTHPVRTSHFRPDRPVRSNQLIRPKEEPTGLLPVPDMVGNELFNGDKVDMYREILDDDDQVTALEPYDWAVVVGIRPAGYAPPKIQEGGPGHWVGLNGNRAHGIHLLIKHLDAAEPQPS